jgi:hypothetical protein
MHASLRSPASCWMSSDGSAGKWDTLARMLREAAHHEASAQILRTGHYHE